MKGNRPQYKRLKMITPIVFHSTALVSSLNFKNISCDVSPRRALRANLLPRCRNSTRSWAAFVSESVPRLLYTPSIQEQSNIAAGTLPIDQNLIRESSSYSASESNPCTDGPVRESRGRKFLTSCQFTIHSSQFMSSFASYTCNLT